MIFNLMVGYRSSSGMKSPPLKVRPPDWNTIGRTWQSG